MGSIAGTDVVVIGGGLLGWAAGYRLAKRGRRVAVVDRADPGYATGAGAGIIAPGTSLAASPAFYALGKLAVEEYDRLIPDLAADGAPDTGYGRVGMLFVARDEAELARLPEAFRRMESRRAEGMGNIGALAWIDPAEAKARFPALMDVTAAIHVPDAARVNGRSLRDALRHAATARGAQAIAADAVVDRSGDRAAVTVEGETVTPEAIVIAGGAWSPALAAALALDLPIYPQRGQIVHFDLPGTDTSAWPILEWFGSHYMLAFPGSRVVCGATREHDSGYDPRLTAAGVREVLDVALGIAPGLAQATLAEVRVGLRPFSPDGLPVLGRAPGLANVYLCTGHGPSGLQLGPVSGAIVAELIDGEAPPLPLAPYAPERYQGAVLDDETARRVAATVDRMV